MKIEAPATGLEPDPSYVPGQSYVSYDGYSQVNFQAILAIGAGGPVNLTNLAVVGGPLRNLNSSGVVDLNSACESYGSDVAGVMYRNTPGTISNVSVTGVFGHLAPYKVGSLKLTLGCGTGIHLKNDEGIGSVTIRKSSINDGEQGGWTGIRADATAVIDHNVVTLTGVGSYGINGVSDDNPEAKFTATSNTVNGSIESTGIYGQGMFNDNTVLHAGTGIVQNFGTGTVSSVIHNTLIDNAVGIIGGEQIRDNLIFAKEATYQQECEGREGGYTSCAAPTVGIELVCSSPKTVGSNSVVGTGIGIEGFAKGTTLPTTNLFADVNTSTMGCFE